MILLTGATGCVGRYILEALLAETDEPLLLLLRNPDALPQALRAHPRVQIRKHDLAQGAAPLADLPPIRTALLVATAWGGPQTRQVIRDANLALAERLIDQGCMRVLYFSTASVLDKKGALLDAAREHGTDYIQGKHALTEAMEGCAHRAEIIGLFPTLVIGGDPLGSHPISHFARLLHQLRRWAWVVRFLDVEARLHVIHAADIASVCVALVQVPLAPPDGQQAARRLVLGNPASSVDMLVRDYARHCGLGRWRLIRLRPALAEVLIRLFRIQLSAWDRHCMQNPDQGYDQPVNPASFGRPLHMPDFTTGLLHIGLSRR
jgi:nucleoside-diphosphate-sugar epimerase